MKKLGSLLLILCCASLLVAQKSVYIWTDDKGVAHVSDQKPEGQANVQEMKYQPMPVTSEPEQKLEKDDSGSYEEEQAKKAAEDEKRSKQEEIAQKREEYNRLLAEERHFLELRDTVENPIGYNYSIQRLNEIELEKQKLEESLKDEE